jgi:hypothetical protein
MGAYGRLPPALRPGGIPSLCVAHDTGRHALVKGWGWPPFRDGGGGRVSCLGDEQSARRTPCLMKRRLLAATAADGENHDKQNLLDGDPRDMRAGHHRRDGLFAAPRPACPRGTRTSASVRRGSLWVGRAAHDRSQARCLDFQLGLHHRRRSGTLDAVQRLWRRWELSRRGDARPSERAAGRFVGDRRPPHTGVTGRDWTAVGRQPICSIQQR